MSANNAADDGGTDSQTTDVDDRDATVADQLGMNIGQNDRSIAELETLLTQGDAEIPPLVSSVLQSLLETIDGLQERIAELETKTDETREIARTAVGDAAATDSRLDELETDHEKTRDIAKSAIAKAEQQTVDEEQQEDVETLPKGVEPSSSPLDFFANCRQTKIKEAFVEQSNRINTYRAIAVVKRWPEFATQRSDGSGVFFTREDLATALTAELGTKPHRQTVSRVWDQLKSLGSEDVVEKRRQVGRSQEPKTLLSMDQATADGLLEKRYVGLDLLKGAGAKARRGGVTPVVTGDTT